MSFLAKIEKGKKNNIPRIMIVGEPGIGKSTFASKAPDALFLDVEQRTGHLDIRRLTPKSWTEVKDIIIEVGKAAKEGKPPCKWLVIDTLDHLALMVYEHVSSLHNVTSIELVEGGYGKGYKIARDTVWREFIRLIDGLRGVGVGVLLLAHSNIKSVQNPAGPDYQTFGLAVDKITDAFFTAQLDAIGYAAFEDNVKAKMDRKGNQVTKGKAETSGRRVLYFGHNPAYDTKPGINLPAEMDLDWSEFSKHLTGDK